MNSDSHMSSDRTTSVASGWGEEFLRRLERRREEARGETESRSARLLQAFELLESRFAELRDSHRGGSTPSAPADDSQAQLRERKIARLEVENAELREEIAAWNELHEESAAAKQSPVNSVKAQSSAIPANKEDDWETCKRRMLEQLESDAPGTAVSRTERITIEETIRRTDAQIARRDEIISEKVEEIAELQRLLYEQSGNIGGMAIGAAAIGGMFDGDELIIRQREHLAEMEEKLQEQLKQAEIDISVERAKLARERVELEERIRRMVQTQPAADTILGPSLAGGTANPNPRSRWLSRLGLGDDKPTP